MLIRPFFFRLRPQAEWLNAAGRAAKKSVHIDGARGRHRTILMPRMKLCHEIDGAASDDNARSTTASREALRNWGGGSVHISAEARQQTEIVLNSFG